MLRFSQRRSPRASSLATLVLMIAAALLLFAFCGRDSQETSASVHTAAPTPSAAPSTAAAATPLVTPTPQVSGGGSAEELVYSGQSFCMLQAGAFSSPEKAASTQQNCLAAGCADYLFQDGERARIFADAFLTAAQGDAEKDRLKAANNLETYCKIYQAKAWRLKITASAAQTQAIRTAFAAYCDLTQAAVSAREANAPAGQWQALSLTAQQAAEALENAVGTSDNSFVASLKNGLAHIAKQTAALADLSTQNPMEFSSRMKYTVVDIVMNYYQTMCDIGNNKLE